jgi:hypothetical protein
VAVYRLFLFLGITRSRDEYTRYEAAGRKTNSVHRELVTQLFILRKGDGTVKLKPPDQSRKLRWERIERSIIKDEVRQLKEMRLGGDLGRGKECEDLVFLYWQAKAAGICIHNTHTHTHTNTHTHKHTHTQTHTHTHTHLYLYIHTYTHTCMHVCACD